MEPWQIENAILFNVSMAGVDWALLCYLRRFRSTAAWWKAGICGVGGSLFLVCLFRLGPSSLSPMSIAGFRSFFVVRLVTYVLFVHAVVCLLGAAWLLRKAARKTAVLSGLGALVLLGAAVDAFWIEPTWLEVTHLRMESPKLAYPIRIAVLADLQTDAAGSYEREVLKRLRDEEPDLILFAGDYVHAHGDRREKTCKELNAMMKEVGLSAPLGVFAVRGNVDVCHDWRRLFKDLPVLALASTQTLDVGPLQLTCLSMRDSFDTGLCVAGGDPNRFHLVLGHSPDFALGRVDADLLVAGHTHGGQIRLPWIGALTTGCRVPRAWASGLMDLPGGGKLLVSRGVGMERGGAPRLRFLCRPELVLIDLVPE